MRAAKPLHFLVLCCSVFILAGNISAQQTVTQASATDNSSPIGHTSLHIALRLPDDSPFIGPANVRVLPNEGYEITGTMETDGQMVFSDVPPGTYVMETSSPGFLTVRQNMRIESGQRLVMRIVIMKPKPFRVRVAHKSAPSSASGVAAEPTSWILPRLDDVIPPVDPDVECPLPHVLSGAAKRMQQFVSNLEKFSASEQVEHYLVDEKGGRHSPESRGFNYVVMVSQVPSGGFLLDEFRNGSVDPQQFPAHIATQGLPGMALVFHPFLASDFRFTCEGLGESQGQAAWQIHFAQRPDRPARIIGYSAAGKYNSLSMKGRAWLDPGNFQVLRLESELIEPVKDIALMDYHVAIAYQPVRFHGEDQQLWLPQTAELYVERQGRRFFRRHVFSNFQLFTVETTQTIQLAQESYRFTNQSDRDVSGVLTVTPTANANLSPVSVSFTIPAGASISKLVGRGKDVAIPVDSVASATFAYNGPPDAIRVDAHLSKESTLDIISGSATPFKP